MPGQVVHQEDVGHESVRLKTDGDLQPGDTESSIGQDRRGQVSRGHQPEEGVHGS